jgi:hypothetical protein
MKWFLLLVAILGVSGCDQKTAAAKPDEPELAQVPPNQIQPSGKSWWSDPKNQQTAKTVGKVGGKVLTSQHGKNFLKKAGAVISAVGAGIGVFLSQSSVALRRR